MDPHTDTGPALYTHTERERERVCTEFERERVYYRWLGGRATSSLGSRRAPGAAPPETSAAAAPRPPRPGPRWMGLLLSRLRRRPAAPSDKDRMAAQDFVDRKVRDNKVIVFSKSYCPYCKKAKQALLSLLAPEQFDVEEVRPPPLPPLPLSPPFADREAAFFPSCVLPVGN